jgi:pimeloyl-ACP methyl ester carboxylesterase
MAVTVERPPGDTAIRPLTIDIPEADLEDLRTRIAAARWPDKETVEDQSQGTPLATLQALAHRWLTEYDWRDCERRLNAHPNFVTEIDGLDIHFIHARSEHEDALPIVICHGWPGSVVEQLKVIDPLIDPTAHDGSASDAFHVVVPSMPGYGFSGKPSETGWDPLRIANAFVELMRRLGYSRFVAQGGDWGAIVVETMAGGRDHPQPAVPAPQELVGIHTNMASAVPPDIHTAATQGHPPPEGLSTDELSAYEQLRFFYGTHLAYAQMMGSRPQTLAGLADSPVGLAAFMIDHDAATLDLIIRAFRGEPTGVTPDDVLDNVTLYWLTNTGVSASRLYGEYGGTFFAVKNVTIPVGVSAFPDELYRAPRSWAERAYPNLVHYNALPVGTHFAAWEQPRLFTDEVRATFRSLR